MVKEYKVTYEKGVIPIVRGLQQWDAGQILTVEGITLGEEEKEIHFSLTNTTGECERVNALYENGVLSARIPNTVFEKETSSLEKEYKAYAYVYIYDNSYQKTEYKICLEVEVRPMPTDYKSPKNIGTIEQLKLDLKQIKEDKLDNNGYEPNKTLKTDEQGNVYAGDPDGVGKETENGGEIFGGYDTNKALGDRTATFGKNNVSGCKGYYIQSIDLTNKKIYLSSAQRVPVISTANNTVSAFVTPQYSVGDYFCVINNNHYIYKATIVSIVNNVVIYDGDLGFTSISGTAKDPHDFSFYVPTKPTVGVASLITDAFAFGLNCVSAGRGGIAGGNGCIVAASSGVALGSQCVAGYVACAIGSNNKALAYYSAIVGGTGNEAHGNYSFITGSSNITYSNYQFIAGYGNIGSKARSCQAIFGMYCDPDTISDKAFVVGWGGSSKRKNIFTLTTSGKAEFTGDVVANGISLATANSNANTAKSNASSALTKASNAEEKVTKLEEYAGIIDIPYLDSVPPINKAIYRVPNNYLALDGKFYDYAAVHTVTDYTQFKIPVTQAVKDSLGNDKIQYNICYDVNQKQYYCYYNNVHCILASTTVKNQVFNGRTYVGAVTNPEDAQNGTYGIFKVYILYMYIENVGYVRLNTDKTKGYFADRFNSPDNKPKGSFSATFGVRTETEGYAAFAGGDSSKASGPEAFSMGAACEAKKYASSATCNHTIADGKGQSVRGEYNEPLGDEYLDIVGNGTSIGKRSNAYTLDRDGNAWFAGSVEAPEMFLRSPNGTRFRITVSDDGILTASKA